MKSTFLFLLALTCVVLPTPVFARITDIQIEIEQQAANSCVPGTESCSCTGETQSFGPISKSTAEECDAWCATMDATSYTLTCTYGNGNSNQPIGQGNVGSTNIGSALTEAPEEEDAEYIVPTLLVPIPGFSNPGNLNNDFSVPTLSSNGSQTSVNFIAEYINAVYGWVLGAAALVAVVMMMIGGLQYTLSRGKPKYIEKAKTRITNAITGMVLLLAAYNIAYLIDPRLTDLQEIGIKNVEGIEYFPPDGEDINVTPNLSLTGNVVPISGDYIAAGCQEGCAVDAETLTALKVAATEFHTATGKNVVITSATRSLGKQAALFYSNCLLSGGVCSPDTCNASSGVVTKSGSKWTLTGPYVGQTSGAAIVAALSDPKNAAYGNCPHTSGVALDAWCDDGGSEYRHDPACQAALIDAMIDAGFCRLSSEVWHFELDSKSVSTACSTSNNSISYTKKGGERITPTSDCEKWNFKLHTCAIKKQ